MTEYKFSDEVIGQVARLVQVAILTGTDVVDNLRTLRVTPVEGELDTLELTQTYREMSQTQMETMLEQAAQYTNQANEAGDAS
mgnify:CR=1 FL=1|jgi:hypothetical protein